MMDTPLSAYHAARLSGPTSEHRPFISLSYAQSLDGSIALNRGSPYRISGEASMALTHSLRAQHDAILVGIGTILADDPQLNVRFHEGNDPQPIILDSHLRTPLTCRVVNGSNPPWIATLAPSTSEKAASLLSKGVQLFHYEDRKFTQIPLDPLLSDLSRKGIMSLMVEGGAEVIQSFIASGFVDWIMLTVGPYFLDGVHAFGHRESTPLSQPVRLENLGWTRQQDDLVVWGNPEPISK